MPSKTQLRDKICRYLKEVKPDTVWGNAIHAAIRYEANNFDNLVKEIESAYYDNKEGVIRIVGAVPVLLILQYTKLSNNEN